MVNFSKCREEKDKSYAKMKRAIKYKQAQEIFSRKLRKATYSFAFQQ